jgi:hypothetical protein
MYLLLKMKKFLSKIIFVSSSILILFLSFEWTKLNDDLNRTRVWFGSNNIISNSFSSRKDELIFIFVVLIIFLIIATLLYFSALKDDEDLKIQKKQIFNDLQDTDYRKVINIHDVQLDKFQGKKDISNDEYKIYLVNKYKVTKNDVFNKYVQNNSLYESIDELLSILHEKENNIKQDSINNIVISNKFISLDLNNSSEELILAEVKAQLHQRGYNIEEAINNKGNRKFNLKKGVTTEYLYSSNELINYYNQLVQIENSKVNS